MIVAQTSLSGHHAGVAQNLAADFFFFNVGVVSCSFAKCLFRSSEFSEQVSIGNKSKREC